VPPPRRRSKRGARSAHVADMSWIERHWYHDSWLSRLLWPVSVLYCAAATVRRYAYRARWRRAESLPVPVVVVGNITVGGTGKTPLVIWIVRHLASNGWRPGIVSRGYGGRSQVWPQRITGNSDPRSVGDEPVVLARRSGVPVVADPDRPRGVRELLAQGCNVVVADDGLQHYRLHRDVEIAVLDGARGLGNARCLPAGPLRERASRWQSVDARVLNGASAPDTWSMELIPTGFRRVRDPDEALPLAEFRGRRVHALAGIGNPDRFFAMLRSLDVQAVEHSFPDHHPFVAPDLEFGDDKDVVMTEKDAVKCHEFASANSWFLAVDAEMDPRFGEWLRQRLRRK
jgi:tetraacyldisaccharide 4'-kinase